MVDTAVLDWLMDSDPSIRWQVMCDLTHEPEDVVATERAKVATEGWGARLLDLQKPDHQWSDGSNSTLIHTPDGSAHHTLSLLLEMGLDPKSERARRAITLVRENVTHWHAGQPFFSGEVEPCINGRVLEIGAYFGEPTQEVLDRLLSEQLEDGGWNCEAENGSTRSSFHSTICVLEGLLEYERSRGADVRVSAARVRGEKYLLDRGMFRSLSTGEVIDPNWTLFSHPVLWHYDVLRGLEYLLNASVVPGDRINEAVAIVEKNRGTDGRWPLQNKHDDQLQYGIEEEVDKPSRWNTLRALRVLDWAGKR